MEFDLYDQRDSWKQIFEGRPAATTPLYFFTKLKKMTEKGTLNWNRRTGGGKWKETQNCGTINDPKTKKPIGNKRSFRFAPNPDTAAQFTGRWLMDEFSLDSRFARQMVDEYVVCCIKRERDRKSKSIVQQTRNSEQLIQQNCRNTSNADSINDTTTTTTVDPEDGLEAIGGPNLCIDLGRDSNCRFAATPTLDPENGAIDNVQMRNSEQAFEVNCGISEANNYATKGTTLDFENGTAEFEDPNMWVELDELLGHLDQTSAETVEENVSGLDHQFATPTTLGGLGFGCSFLMDTPIHNQISHEKAATS